MISFHFESDYRILDLSEYSDWVARIIESEGFTQGDISYIFYTDEKLLELNQEYLKHDTFTDIITFDYCDGKMVSGDIFISTDRVKDNARAFEVSFENEMKRVMSHGLLHLLGYGDKTDEETVVMRAKEEEKIKMFHVEQ